MERHAKLIYTNKPNIDRRFSALKIWREELCKGHIEWRGSVLNVDNGEEIQFHDWPELVDVIANVLDDPVKEER